MTRNTKIAVAVLIGLAVLTWLALNWVILEKFGAYNLRLSELAKRMEKIMDEQASTSTESEGCLETDVPCPAVPSGVVHVKLCCKENEERSACVGRFLALVEATETGCNQ